MNKIILFLFLLFYQAGDAAAGMWEPIQHSAFTEEKVENPHFKDIVVTKKNGQYVITGNCMVKKGVFYYSVEDGHRVLLPETKVRVNNLNWTSFKLSITVPTKYVQENGVLILNLFEKNRSRENSDSFPVVLESFKD